MDRIVGIETEYGCLMSSEELRCNSRMVLELFAVGHSEKELVGSAPSRRIRNPAIDLGQSLISRQLTRSRS